MSNNGIDYMDELDTRSYTPVEKTNATYVGLVGGLLTILFMFFPFVKDFEGGYSLFKLGLLSMISGIGSSMTDKENTMFLIAVASLAIIVLSVVYIVNCFKKNPAGMVIPNIIIVLLYIWIKGSLKHRGIVPGEYDKAIGFILFLIAFLIMIVGSLMNVNEKKHMYG